MVNNSNAGSDDGIQVPHQWHHFSPIKKAPDHLTIQEANTISLQYFQIHRCCYVSVGCFICFIASIWQGYRILSPLCNLHLLILHQLLQNHGTVHHHLAPPVVGCVNRGD